MMKITSKTTGLYREPPLAGAISVIRALESADTNKTARPLGENSMDVTKIICVLFNF